MLAALLFPWALTAAGAAAAPVIIHLIMRTKPRRVTFPAVAFVRKTHQANISRHKLKHLILLLMRMLLIALLALLIAGWYIPNWRHTPATSDPAAVVVVVDDSGSMGYRAKGQSLLGRARGFAEELLETLPDGSRVALIRSGAPDAGLGFQSDLEGAGRQLTTVAVTPSAASVAGAMSRAVELLDNVTDLSRKEVYVLTDMTAQAWRDGSGVRGREDADKRFILYNAGGEDRNAMLGSLDLSVWSVPVGAPVTIRTRLRRPEGGAAFGVRVEMDGAELYRTLPGDLEDMDEGAELPYEMLITPPVRGVASGRVALTGVEGVAPLPLDNERYFSLKVQPPAELVIVRDEVEPVVRGKPTSVAMRTALAPPGAEVAARRWLTTRTLLSDRLDAASLEGAEAVLLAGVTSLREDQWTALTRYVDRGGNLWIVVGPTVSPESYNAAPVMPLSLEGVQTLPEPMHLDPVGSHPLLETLAEQDDAPLSRVRCTARFRVRSLGENSQAVLRYADGVPALVWQERGGEGGEVVFWNFSPLRSFSNLAYRDDGAQFVVMTRRILQLLLSERPTLHTWGETVTVRAPSQMGSPRAAVRRPSGGFRDADLDGNGRTVTIYRADVLGHWQVRFRDEAGAEYVHGFSVNADPAESDLTSADTQEVTDLFPPGQVSVVSDFSETAAAAKEVARDLDLTVPVLLAILVLLTAESYFANRFYRRPGESPVEGVPSEEPGGRVG